jgi:hypothetical protein
MGLPRKRNYAGRWDVLIDKCTKCLVKLLEVASRRRRNYILDQVIVNFFFVYCLAKINTLVFKNGFRSTLAGRYDWRMTYRVVCIWD